MNGKTLPGEPVSACDPHSRKARVLNAQCATCIYRPGNLMRLSPGRLRQMTQDALREGSQGIICHSTLPYGDHPESGPAICGGFWELHGHRNNFLRVMGRIGGIVMTDPPGEEEP
jgi:hypothetical protein